MKIIKKLLIILLLLVVAGVGLLMVGISMIKMDMDFSALPQDVYTESGDLKSIAELKLLRLVTLMPSEDEYTIVEEFINYMILDTIHEKINAEYDPLSEDDEIEKHVIVDQSYYYIDYLFAMLNDEDQLVLVVSFGSEYIINVHSVLFLTFDIDINMFEFEVVFTLAELALGDQPFTVGQLDYVLSRLDQSSIEESVSFGTLDLENHTYTVSILNP
ncbi:MAG: hypothetical protein KKE16_04360 [Firmicutes bacterium]|nr:hypothetical protein [Bacillota bacterium]